MRKIDLGQTLGILANLGVLAGIVFLAYELRQNTLTTQLSATESFTAALTNIELFIVENSEFSQLLQKSIAGEAISASEQFRLDVFYRAVLRLWQTTHYQYLNAVLDEGIWDGQRQGYLSTLAGDQGLQAYWRENNARYTPQFNEFIKTMLEDGAIE